MQRTLLYTAITRARRLCVVVGDPRALRHAVENSARAARNTGLAERLRGPRLPARALDPFGDEEAFPLPGDL